MTDTRYETVADWRAAGSPEGTETDRVLIGGSPEPSEPTTRDSGAGEKRGGGSSDTDPRAARIEEAKVVAAREGISITEALARVGAPVAPEIVEAAKRQREAAVKAESVIRASGSEREDTLREALAYAEEVRTNPQLLEGVDASKYWASVADVERKVSMLDQVRDVEQSYRQANIAIPDEVQKNLALRRSVAVSPAAPFVQVTDSGIRITDKITTAEKAGVRIEDFERLGFSRGELEKTRQVEQATEVLKQYRMDPIAAAKAGKWNDIKELYTPQDQQVLQEAVRQSIVRDSALKELESKAPEAITAQGIYVEEALRAGVSKSSMDALVDPAIVAAALTKIEAERVESVTAEVFGRTTPTGLHAGYEAGITAAQAKQAPGYVPTIEEYALSHQNMTAGQLVASYENTYGKVSWNEGFLGFGRGWKYENTPTSMLKKGEPIDIVTPPATLDMPQASAMVTAPYVPARKSTAPIASEEYIAQYIQALDEAGMRPAGDSRLWEEKMRAQANKQYAETYGAAGVTASAVARTPSLVAPALRKPFYEVLFPGSQLATEPTTVGEWLWTGANVILLTAPPALELAATTRPGLWVASKLPQLYVSEAEAAGIMSRVEQAGANLAKARQAGVGLTEASAEYNTAVSTLEATIPRMRMTPAELQRLQGITDIYGVQLHPSTWSPLQEWGPISGEMGGVTRTVSLKPGYERSGGRFWKEISPEEPQRPGQNFRMDISRGKVFVEVSESEATTITSATVGGYRAVGITPPEYAETTITPRVRPSASEGILGKGFVREPLIEEIYGPSYGELAAERYGPGVTYGRTIAKATETSLTDDLWSSGWSSRGKPTGVATILRERTYITPSGERITVPSTESSLSKGGGAAPSKPDVRADIAAAGEPVIYTTWEQTSSGLVIPRQTSVPPITKLNVPVEPAPVTPGTPSPVTPVAPTPLTPTISTPSPSVVTIATSSPVEAPTATPVEAPAAAATPVTTPTPTPTSVVPTPTTPTIPTTPGPPTGTPPIPPPPAIWSPSVGGRGWWFPIAGRTHPPLGTVAWKQGMGWHYIPPNYDQPKPLYSKYPPVDAVRLSGTPQETLTFVGGVVPFDNLSFDLGVVDGYIDVERKLIIFKGYGLQTDAGRRLPSTTKGMSIPAAKPTRVVKRKPKYTRIKTQPSRQPSKLVGSIRL